MVKNPPANTGDVGDMGCIPGSGRSPGGWHGNPLQYSCLENPMDREAWQVAVHGVAKSLDTTKHTHTHFPDSSAGKEPTCSAGDPSSIPRSGRSTRVGIGNPLQYSSFVVQLVKNPSAMWETWVPSLGWEDPLEKEKATHSSILALRIPWTVYSPWG